MATINGENIMFMSDEMTGNGFEQSIAHDLGQVPSKVFTATTGAVAIVAPTILQGVHTSSVLKITCTTGWRYRILAWI